MKKNEVIPEKVVFISYRRAASSTLASAVAQGLIDKYNFDVFFDKYDTEPGEIEEKLKKNIDNCTHFILFVNDKTFDYKTKRKSKRNQKTKTNQNRDDKYLLIEITHALEKYNKSRESIKIIPIYVNMKKLNNDDKRLINNKIEQIADFDWIQYDEEKETPVDLIRDVLKKMGYDDSAERERERREKNIKKLKQSIFAILATVVAAAGLVFGGTLLQKYITSKAQKIPEPPKLVFAGGGSVANMIKEITDDSVDIEHYKNAIYLNMPSKDAWTLMAEEVMTDHTSDIFQNKFYPVCLSALEADSKDDFLKTVDDTTFVKNGTIISYKLREDPLIVYLDSVHEKKLNIKDGKIRWDILESKIQEWCKGDFTIFATRIHSGTRTMYEKISQKIFSSCGNHFKSYDKNLSMTILNTLKNYVVLSSQYYTPDQIRDSKDLEPIMVVDSNGNVILKKMYLYFAGYKREGKTDSIIMPVQMVNFIKRIDTDTDTKKIIKPVMYYPHEWVITPFDELKKMQSKKKVFRNPNTKPTKSK